MFQETSRIPNVSPVPLLQLSSYILKRSPPRGDAASLAIQVTGQVIRTRTGTCVQMTRIYSREEYDNVEEKEEEEKECHNKERKGPNNGLEWRSRRKVEKERNEEGNELRLAYGGNNLRMGSFSHIPTAFPRVPEWRHAKLRNSAQKGRK
jgi:hypothetical protein